ncbi:MAG: Zn-ribbon domain-containing OB-fold protein [Thermoplasmatota archaeon]
MAIPRFWREIDQRYNLNGSHCSNCNQYFFPARALCPRCRHLSVGKIKPAPFSGEGTIETFTVVHQPPPGFELQSPYVIAIIRLAEGPKVTAQVVDVKADQVHTGQRVHKVFRRINQDGQSGVIHYGYKFAPSPAPNHAVEARP